MDLDADPHTFHRLWRLLDCNRPVAIHSRLIELTRNAKSALLLSQLVHCTRVASAPEQGWVQRSTAQWFAELGLSRREQESARAALRALDVIEEALIGQPALRCYRLRLPQLMTCLSAHGELSGVPLDLQAFCADDALVNELLGRTVPYHRALAQLTGSVNAALLLTHVLFKHRRHLRLQGWFRLSRAELERELALGRREQEAARTRLRAPRFIEERMEYLPPRLYARAVPPMILAALRALDPRQSLGQSVVAKEDESANQDIGHPALRQVQNRQPRHGNRRFLRGTEAPSKSAEIPLSCLVQPDSPESRSLGAIKELAHLSTAQIAGSESCSSSSRYITTTTTTDAHSNAQTFAVSPVRQQEVSPNELASSLTTPSTPPVPLAFPTGFLPEERMLAERELAALELERAQLLLDEIEGRSRKGRRVDTRIGLLCSLVEAERAGRFKPCYAWEVKSAREREAQRAAEHEARERAQREAALVRDGETSPDGKTGYEAFKTMALRLRRCAEMSNPTNDPSSEG